MRDIHGKAVNSHSAANNRVLRASILSDFDVAVIASVHDVLHSVFKDLLRGQIMLFKDTCVVDHIIAFLDNHAEHHEYVLIAKGKSVKTKQ